ncbi:HotDog domain-containing protein [Podospora didyma]|uniref:HotDog domain-containing protein n=1 Tax=Podospora didyma TaxID=330526 RepID=A0AAE0N404_9PEZI|nr:HotDog domain-containing protein [Podospora didyma]
MDTPDDAQQRAAAAAEIAHFQSIPWCAKRLAAGSKNQVVTQSFSRLRGREKPPQEDALISEALNRPDAIAGFITFYTPPPPTNSKGELVREVHAFLTLGPMLNGWAGICHGGIVMTILDEVMGQLPAVNKLRGVMSDMPLMTAYLNTKFLRPVRTGTTIMVTARFTKIEGRKHWTEGFIYDEHGNVLASADALFIVLKARL